MFFFQHDKSEVEHTLEDGTKIDYFNMYVFRSLQKRGLTLDLKQVYNILKNKPNYDETREGDKIENIINDIVKTHGFTLQIRDKDIVYMKHCNGELYCISLSNGEIFYSKDYKEIIIT